MQTYKNCAVDISSAVSNGRISACDVVDSCLDKIKRENSDLTCFTDLSTETAKRDAKHLDERIRQGSSVGPLAGVPFAVKDLFDVSGESTKAGAQFRETAPPANQDADLVARLRAADAIYLGRLNMDEFAYGFATVNANYGTTKNPYDRNRLAGGSSGGSAAAVAADLIPLSLGSDTNGSIRVPASLCGLYGLRPTHASLPMTGVFPFVKQLDTAGPFTKTLDDLVAVYRVLSNTNSPHPPKRHFKAARLDGWFRINGEPDGLDGVDAIGQALGGAPLLEIALTEAARSAAFLITSKYGGLLHQSDLESNAMAYDPAVRDRLVAGVALLEEKTVTAEQVIERFNASLNAAFKTYDLLIAPTTPTVAPLISDGFIEVDGKMVSARANLGLYTQPLSVAGIPILSVPLLRPGKLPLGVQLIAKRGHEDDLFDAARLLESAGVIGASPPPSPTREMEQ
ncbi:MAG: AtzE family amidohydrolase [Pseudomonadota bacterium]